MILEIPGYAIEEKLGSGGMAHVYRARHQRLDRLVALKVMHPELTLRDEDFSRRFLREARIAANLIHPNIVQVYDVNQHENLHYIAMEYLEGGDLQQRLRHPITRDKLIRLVTDVAAALDFAHNRGYIHRDIKPANILFRHSGEALVSDFGIARAISSNTLLTQVGTVMGSPNYMSPEQASGKSPDGSTDLYSLAAIVFEILTGRVPYEGDSSLSIAIKHITEPVPTLPQGLHAVQPFIDKGMAKDPAHRFRSGAEMVSMLSEALGQLTAQEMSRVNTLLLVNPDEKATVVAVSKPKAAPPVETVAPVQAARKSEPEEELVAATVVAQKPGSAEAATPGVSDRHEAPTPKKPVPPQVTAAKGVDEPPRNGVNLKVLGAIAAVLIVGLLITVLVSMQRNAAEVENRKAAQAAEQLRLAVAAKEAAEAKALAEAQKREEAEAQAQARELAEAKAEAERAACAENPSCLMDAGGGVLRQTVTGLDWTQSDNGRNIGWSGARSWCTAKGGNWRLPSVQELQSLYDASGTVSTSCGSSTCRSSPLFRLTSYVFWSNQREGSSETWFVFLFNGVKYLLTASLTDDFRALCVRGSQAEAQRQLNIAKGNKENNVAQPTSAGVQRQKNIDKGSVENNVAQLTPTVDVSSAMSKMKMTAGNDRDIVPLVRINPDYPPRALSRGIQGWVIVQFTISATGTVKDQKVVDSSNNIFDDAALKAIARWRYNPKVEEGVAVERKSVQTKLVFQLEN